MTTARAEAIGTIKGYIDRYLTAVAKAVEERLLALVAALPPPADGERGTDGIGVPGPAGKDCDMDAVRAHIADEVEKAVAALPKPADGKSVSVDDVLPIIVERVAAEFAAIPIPENGKQGEPGIPGRDAVGLPGLPGKDGISPDSVSLEMVGRTLVLRMKTGDGERMLEAKHSMPMDRGVFKTGELYDSGDIVRYASALWIAQRGTGVNGWNHDDWRLMIKRHGK